MGIREDLDEIKNIVKEQEKEKNKKKEKQFKFPFWTRVGKGQAKKDYVTVMRINTNGEVTFKRSRFDMKKISSYIASVFQKTQRIIQTHKQIYVSWSDRFSSKDWKILTGLLKLVANKLFLLFFNENLMIKWKLFFFSLFS